MNCRLDFRNDDNLMFYITIYMEVVNVTDDFPARKDILKFEVYCKNKAEGCEDRMTWKEQIAHYNDKCKFTRVPCPNRLEGCHELILRKDLHVHTEDDCLYRQVVCPHCNEAYKAISLAHHIEELCSEKMKVCPFGCSSTKTYKNDQLKEHMEVCPNKKESCRLASFGCEYLGTREELIKHENDGASHHIEIMANIIGENRLVISRLKTLHQDMMNNQDIMRNDLSRLNAVTTQCQSKVEEINDSKNITEGQINELKEGVRHMRQEVSSVDSNMLMVQRSVQEMQSQFMSLSSGGNAASNSRSDLPDNFNNHFQALERQVGLHDLQISEMDLQYQILETATYDGILLWKIKDYKRRKKEAKDGKSLSLYSQPFYTSRHGYKMCARVYLNGDGMGKGTHLSLFFVIMRGEYDQLLQWPFTQKVTLIILDQERRNRHLQDAFRPDRESSSFRRPTSEMNIASGCPRFVSHDILEKGETYIKNDCMFIKIKVDITGLDPP
ncbi:TNF receptor-associated factor 3-like isoform X2 [Tubulanus polymorphus]|uniref:TNF receptor-associated factor 3-like isoform X2 n=1 Tax=Tubulanus polymorphus TaxID=672921 RepID=UPI003DA2E178